MRDQGSVWAEATGYELHVECAECEGDDRFDCPDCCNEPLDEAKENGWIFKVTKDGAIFAFCDEDCLKKYGEDGLKDCSTGAASFDEWEGCEVRC